MDKKHVLPWILVLLLVAQIAKSQPFSFAHVSDTHIGSDNAVADLRATVADINAQPGLRFVIISGDITEFGADEELLQARQLLDSLNKPWYIVPGNHDDNWSESGTNSFLRIFGKETFNFSYAGYQFLGTNCGPNMRMGPGQVPHEHLVWLDSIMAAGTKGNRNPLIFVNHYPIDPALNNWYEVVDRLKQTNIQAILCGHGHANHAQNFEGIPGVMGRSNLRAKDSAGGYNVVTITGDSMTYQLRKSGVTSALPWTTVRLQDHHFEKDGGSYPRPSYAVNMEYPKVKTVWNYQDRSDIICGFAFYKDLLITANTVGEIRGIDKRSGKSAWRFRTGGKVFSTPAVEGQRVVIASTDGNVYCLDAATGSRIWMYQSGGPIVASPLIRDGAIYIGSSKGHFFSLHLSDGLMRWDFAAVHGFIASLPLYYGNRLYFGSWGNEFYALNAETGALDWKWNSGSTNRMFSAASCVPVAANGKVFIVAPDRYMTAIDAGTGKTIWRKKWDSISVRESMGLSQDSATVYVKTMQGKVLGLSTLVNEPGFRFESPLDLGYELDPAVIVEERGIVYVPSDKGLATALLARDGSVQWQYKISNTLLNSVRPDPERKGFVYLSAADGKIRCLNIAE